MRRLTTFPLRGIHIGETATVVGRGPSLLTLTSSSFESGPILALNHAILEVRKLHLPNPLYSMQKDGCLVQPIEPETVILSSFQSRTCWASYPKRYVVDVTALGMGVHGMSATFAVAMAHLMGCAKVRMLACDGFTNGDFRTVKGDELVMVGRGYVWAGRQASAMARKLKIPVEWVA